MKDIKNFEQLRDYLWEDKQSCYEDLVENLEEWSEFQRGRAVGYIHGIQEVMDILRHHLKYGEDFDNKTGIDQ